MSAPQQQPVTDNPQALPDADAGSDDAVLEPVELEPAGSRGAGGAGDDLLVREKALVFRGFDSLPVRW